MLLSSLISFIIYAFVTSVTPGPNNIMLASSGVIFGFKRTIPHILGIGFGFGLMVLLVGLGVGSILLQFNILYEVLKVIGIIYLLYLAYQIFKSDTVSSSDSHQSVPLSFIQAAMFQWVNPKAWVMTLGAVTTYTSSASSFMVFILVGIVYGVISIPSVGVWAYIGDKAKHLINSKAKVRQFNILMAILLFFSILNPLIESIIFFTNYYLYK